jgi:hypothetical protein
VRIRFLTTPQQQQRDSNAEETRLPVQRGAEHAVAAGYSQAALVGSDSTEEYRRTTHRSAKGATWRAIAAETALADLGENRLHEIRGPTRRGFGGAANVYTFKFVLQAWCIEQAKE